MRKHNSRSKADCKAASWMGGDHQPYLCVWDSKQKPGRECRLSLYEPGRELCSCPATQLFQSTDDLTSTEQLTVPPKTNISKAIHMTPHDDDV